MQVTAEEGARLGLRVVAEHVALPCPHYGGSGVGCTVYDRRPEICRAFQCGPLRKGTPAAELLELVALTRGDRRHAIRFLTR